MSACNSVEKPGFGIYLADSGELIFSDEHIGAYYWDSHTIELNNKGLEKWNSYIDDVDIPRLDTKFYKEGFVVKIKGEEIYRGQFTSIVSSAFPQGVVITDASVILKEKRNIITIGYWQPTSSDTEADPRNSQEIFDYLSDKGLLK